MDYFGEVLFEDGIAQEASAAAELPMFTRGSVPQECFVSGQGKRLAGGAQRRQVAGTGATKECNEEQDEASEHRGYPPAQGHLLCPWAISGVSIWLRCAETGRTLDRFPERVKRPLSRWLDPRKTPCYKGALVH